MNTRISSSRDFSKARSLKGRCSLGPYDSDRALRSCLDKQPTDFLQTSCYFARRLGDVASLIAGPKFNRQAAVSPRVSTSGA